MCQHDRMKKQHVQLSKEDRQYLETLTSTGELSVKVYRRAIALLELDREKTYTAVAETIHSTISTVSGWAAQYREEGLTALYDKPRSGRPVEIDGPQRAKVTALACSEPPEGYARWSLRLLADKSVELGLCEHLSHTEAGHILKKTF